MLKLTVNVTQENIEEGARTDCRKCPIALAANTALPDGFKVIGVASCIAVISDEGAVYEGTTPRKAVNFITDFDLEGADAVEPFSFEIELKPKRRYSL